MAQERTDEELLAAYQQGDPGAFEALLRRHRAPLFTFARNLCIDQSRRDRFRRADSLDAEGPDGQPSMVDSVPGREIDPERAAASARVRPLLQQALLGLPPEQREVF